MRDIHSFNVLPDPAIHIIRCVHSGGIPSGRDHLHDLRCGGHDDSNLG